MHRIRSARWIPVLVALTTVAACDNGSTEPDPDLTPDVPGEYYATAFIAIDDGVERDVHAEGGRIDVTLHDDGTTTGTLFIPEGDEDGSDFEADLDGTWAQDGNTVTFDHEADTFLRDMTFTWDGALRLTADQEFGGGQRIIVELTEAIPVIPF